jgi:hypothetical protein
MSDLFKWDSGRGSEFDLLDEDDMVSDRDDAAPSQQSVKAYVDGLTYPLLDEDNMTSNSDSSAASQQSIKAYVDGLTYPLLDEDDMSSNSASSVPSQQSVKAYVDKGRFVGPYDSRWVGTAGQPLTSTSFDGDPFSTATKTLVDLSSTHGVPANIKGAIFRVICRDAASTGATYWFGLSPNNTSNSLAGAARADRAVNDSVGENTFPCPCDANGDVYYQCAASGSGTLDVWVEIWGYWL